MLMSASPTPEGPGSVSGAPNLPAGFTDTFTSRYVDVGALRLHAVIGGDGPPLLLVHGWPQTWYAWRMLLPTLAQDFQVVAVDQRGIGLSDKPEEGYDTATLAGDLVALMEALGHQRFALYGTDTGMLISYALAADHPDRLERLVVSEAPLWGSLPHTRCSFRRRSTPGSGTSPSTSFPPRSTKPWSGAGKRSSSARSSPPRPGRRSCPPTPSATTSTPSPPTRRPARQLPALPRLPRHHGAGRAAQDPAADHAHPGHRRRGKLRCHGRGHDAAGRRRRAAARHPRLRPLGRRASARGAAGRADRVPGPLPGRSFHMNAAPRRLTGVRAEGATDGPGPKWLEDAPHQNQPARPLGHPPRGPAAG
ncbi:MAG TPA: alpha/beta fold hydrolase [Actinomycetes bacterium]